MKLILFFSFLLLSTISFIPGAHGQSYLGKNGGFEGPDVVVDDATAYPTGGQPGKWTKANASQTILLETTVTRSGDRSLKVNNTSTTGRRVYTSTFSPFPGQRLVIQYYRRVANTTNTQESQAELSRNGSNSLTTNQGAYSVPGSANVWEKVVFSPTATDYSSPTYGSILTRQLGTGGDLYIDDVAIYLGSAEDNTAPNSPTNLSVQPRPTNPSSEVDISWASPAGGTDGGGYMVVRYEQATNPDNDPNVNGIYAVGNTYNNGTGSLTGTVVYVGTETSITNSGLSYGTVYSYKVYAFDKAYNYSIEALGIVSTTGANFYSKSTGNLNELSSWGSNPDGSGAAPASFAMDYQAFIIKNRATATINGNWTVSGQGSEIRVGDGVNPTTFTIPEAFRVISIANVNNMSTLVNFNEFSPAMGLISPNSTVEFAYLGGAIQYIPSAPYGNVIVSGAGTKSPGSDFLVLGDLTIRNGAPLMSHGFIISIRGNWKVESGGNYDPGTSIRSSINFLGNTTHTINAFEGETFMNLKSFAGAIIQMNTDVRVDSNLNLISGKILIGAHSLTLNGGFIGSADNSIVGSKQSNLDLEMAFANGDLYFDQSASNSNSLNSLLVNGGSVSLQNLLKIAPSPVVGGSKSGFVRIMNAGVLNTLDNLVLTSDATGTARIMAGSPSGNYLTGKVMAHKYLPGGETWRLLSSPIQDFSLVINQAWQEGHTYPNIAASSETTGIGTIITGGSIDYPDAASAQSSGFDFLASQGPLSSIRIYNGNWNTSLLDGTIATSVSDYPAYLLLYKGDRKTPGVATNSTLLRTFGNPGKGDRGPLSINQPFYLVGNTYPSPLDFEKIYNSNPNIENRFWKWNPNFSTNGTYMLVQRNGANNYFNVPNNFGAPAADVQHIAVGEGFFVKAGTAGATVMIHEADKSDSTNTNKYNGPAAQAIFVNLYKTGTVDTLADGVAGLFGPDFEQGIDNADVNKPANFAENFYLRRSSQSLMLEGHPLVSGMDTLFLGLTQTTERAYRIKVKTERFVDNGVAAFLEDNFLHTKTPVTLDGAMITYDFTITSNAASKAVDRFMITFVGNQLLPLNFTSVKAYPQNSEIAVEWAATNEVGVKMYQVERSVNGVQFNNVANLKARNNGGINSAYNWLDQTPVNGYNYYRIRSISLNGDYHYSKIVRASINSGGKTSIAVYPNPVKGNTLSLQLTNMEKGVYTAILYDQIGHLVSTRTITHAGGTASQSFDLGSISSGMYHLQVVGGTGVKLTIKLNKN